MKHNTPSLRRRQPDIEATKVANKADNLIKCNLKMYLFGYVFFFCLLFLVRNNIFRLKRSKKKLFIKMYIIEPTTERTGERREIFCCNSVVIRNLFRNTSQKSRNRPVRMNHRYWYDRIGLNS